MSGHFSLSSLFSIIVCQYLTYSRRGSWHHLLWWQSLVDGEFPKIFLENKTVINQNQLISIRAPIPIWELAETFASPHLVTMIKIWPENLKASLPSSFSASIDVFDIKLFDFFCDLNLQITSNGVRPFINANCLGIRRTSSFPIFSFREMSAYYLRPYFFLNQIYVDTISRHSSKFVKVLLSLDFLFCFVGIQLCYYSCKNRIWSVLNSKYWLFRFRWNTFLVPGIPGTLQQHRIIRFITFFFNWSAYINIFELCSNYFF